MDLEALKDELTNDPLGRGYASMSDAEAADSFAVNDRQPNRETLEGGLLVASIVRSELAGLSATDREYVRIVVAAQSLPLTQTLKQELGAIFPAGSQTRDNLIALMKRPGNRADELGFDRIPTPSDIADARRL